MVFTEEGTFIRRRYLRTKVKVTCKLVLSRFLAFHRQIVTFLKMDDPFKIPLGHGSHVGWGRAGTTRTHVVTWVQHGAEPTRRPSRLPPRPVRRLAHPRHRRPPPPRGVTGRARWGPRAPQWSTMALRWSPQPVRRLPRPRERRPPPPPPPPRRRARWRPRARR